MPPSTPTPPPPPPDGARSEITGLLLSWRGGDLDARDRAIAILYPTLEEIARRQLRGERPGHTLQTAGLINEAYLRLVGADVTWQGRGHFLAAAATTMRRVLVDYARAHRGARRGGGAEAVTLDEGLAGAPPRADDILALDEAIDRLATLNRRQAELIELAYFGGYTYDEMAEIQGISPATVDRELRVAKRLLGRLLQESD
jgi:RNA polymerase sigma factor (TIGR02999 family)